MEIEPFTWFTRSASEALVVQQSTMEIPLLRCRGASYSYDHTSICRRKRYRVDRGKMTAQVIECLITSHPQRNQPQTDNPARCRERNSQQSKYASVGHRRLSGSGNRQQN